MAVPVKRLERRLARKQALLGAQHAVIIDLLAHVNGPLTGVHPAPYAPVEMLDRPAATGTSVAFSSLGLDHGLVAPEFTGVLSETTDALVFVKDFQRHWFQYGLGVACPDRAATIAALQTILAPLPRPWRFIGSSAGAWAALYFGAYLEADTVFAFAPQTHLDEATIKRFTGFEPDDTRIDLSDPENDLSQVLADHPLAGQGLIVRAEENKMDRRHAAHLAGTANLFEMVLRGKTHHVAYHLRKAGRLNALLAQAPNAAGTPL